ncbi:MAG: L-threonylcarbamoyladenylate synthase [Phycisphaerae bacterium]|jgi:tRNA threonylcarbamoyl adenosine modification protein (Sua5/YciO/YrdC/YwlC family)|nr:L-threonylcarbamoyladenylate synthase [Phycisphaerae bacterium]MDP7287945.1 L-threonylcarbamoyladenylate synthase [Phycisphaerae bacterium]
MSTRVIKVDPLDTQASIAAAVQGSEALIAGQLVGFATETVYGVAAVASNPEAMERLRDMKDRPERPFSVHIPWPEDVGRYVADVGSAAAKVIHKAWPGPITLVLETGGRFPDPQLQAAGLHDELTSEGRIGLRCPDAPIARMMLDGVGQIVVAPSANLAGHPSPRTGADVLADLDGRIDLLIDSGPTDCGGDSTILACSDERWDVLRAGVCQESDIQRIMAKTYVFVCTGNTCRSPMAEGLAIKALSEKLGCEPNSLEDNGFCVESAGLFAFPGGAASPQSVEAARKFGADISQHASQKLTSELINSSDLIFCCTRQHLSEARCLAPSAAAKMRLLDPDGDIPDPIGADVGVYLEIAERIDSVFRKYLEDEQGSEKE